MRLGRAQLITGALLAQIVYASQCLVIAEQSATATIGHLQGEMAGEVTSHSVILQSRLTATKIGEDGDVPGRHGTARFQISREPEFDKPRVTAWLEATPANDYIVKTKVTGLKASTRYFYRLEFGADKARLNQGAACTFRTHHSQDAIALHSFVVVTGMNHHMFHKGSPPSRPPYAGADKHLGYPALVSILRLRPDFFVGTGDNVYYDSPRNAVATTAKTMRKKWHEQFVQSRYVELFAQVPTYWEKDDHDYRCDDCDNTGDNPPSIELGLRTFREQVPVTDPNDSEAVTYRTHRAGKLLQIWLPENRDYRSPNASRDGPTKTIWGTEQREWLQQTLLESDATFKIIISPTPMIGPDDRRKQDNHCDIDGFQSERASFFAWAKERELLEKGLYLVCGDRHWQYHSIHPSGFEEFSCGALVDNNSRLGVKPGDRTGSDPDAEIQQPYTSREPSGGFLNVVVEPDETKKAAIATFNFYDEHGDRLHSVEKRHDIDAK